MKKIFQLTLLTITMLLFVGCSFKTPPKNKLIENPSVLKEVPNKDNEFYYLNKTSM